MSSTGTIVTKMVGTDCRLQVVYPDGSDWIEVYGGQTIEWQVTNHCLDAPHTLYLHPFDRTASCDLGGGSSSLCGRLLEIPLPQGTIHTQGECPTFSNEIGCYQYKVYKDCKPGSPNCRPAKDPEVRVRDPKVLWEKLRREPTK